MGCAPSQSGIIRNLASNLAVKRVSRDSLHKLNNFPISLLVESSSLSDADSKSYKDSTWENNSLEEKNLTENSNGSNPRHSFSKDSSQSNGQRGRNGTERMAKENDYGKPQKRIPGSVPLSKQSSTESEAGAHYERHPRKGRRSNSQKATKQGRRAKFKDRSAAPLPDLEVKVDFPDHLVEAHQSTYSYLNPNLSKYEAVISMANQATETQLIVQQMVSFLLLRFDEINRILEEISNDGDQLLKEIGNNLTWPLEKGDTGEQPDLLPQLLQYTVNKMQVLNTAAASITSEVLQNTYSYLESAVTVLKEKLKTKEMFDERLVETIKLLETSAGGSCPSLPNDLTLYSEDSGIGADNDSVKESLIFRKSGRQASSHSLAQGFSGDNPRVSPVKPKSIIRKSHDRETGTEFKDTATPSFRDSFPSATAATTSPVFNRLSSPRSSLYNSPQDSYATLEPEIGNADDLVESADDDNNCFLNDNEANECIAEMLMNPLPRRPMTSPAATGFQRRNTTWNVQNEELTLKMKEAISEKIKFIPFHSGNNVWNEEEGLNSQPTRPSTGSASRTNLVQHRRSRSAESLKSLAEDPTLLELQRTQKELNKRLNNKPILTRRKYPEEKKKTVDVCLPSPQQHKDCVMLASSMNKLKASLEKHFSILPNQDKIPPYKRFQNATSIPNEHDRRLEILNKVKIEDEVSSLKKDESFSPSTRQSVKKLIETFSPSENIMKYTNSRALGPLKCIQKFGVPVLPPSIPVHCMFERIHDKCFGSSAEGLDSKSFGSPEEGNSETSTTTFPPIIPSALCIADSNEGFSEDLDSFPPPPPEILMDTSSSSLGTEESGKHTDTDSSETFPQCAKYSGPQRKMNPSEKIKATLSAIDVLPSKHVPCMTGNKVGRSIIKQTKFSMDLHRTSTDGNDQDSALACQRNQEKEEAAQLYKQSHKIIPLQNTGSVSKSSDHEEHKDPRSSISLIQRQLSPFPQRKPEKSPPGSRKNSPTRSQPSSPIDKQYAGPSRYIYMSPTKSRPPSILKNASSAISPAPSSPTLQKKPHTPPPQPHLPSSPLLHRPSNIKSQRQTPSPTGSCRAASPPSFSTPSPPTSPSSLQKRRPRSSSDVCLPSKIGSNAQSIFCPSSSSLFMSKTPSPSPNSSSSDDSVASYHHATPMWKNSPILKELPEQQRRVALSSANPQPFVRRSLSDRRPRIRLRLPVSIPAPASSDSETPTKSDERVPPKRAEDSGIREGTDEAERSSSNMELCIVGQRLQKD